MNERYSDGYLCDIANSATYKLKKRLVQDYGLTPKEVFLAVEMYKKMRSNKELSSDLNISKNTLTGRLFSIYAKLGLTARNQLIIKIVELLEKDNLKGSDIVKQR